MTPRRFDRFMVHTRIASDPKIVRLSDAEFRCHIGGVLALAAESPVRGALLVAEGLKVEESDVAARAGKSVAVARATLKKLRKLGILKRDPNGVEWVSNWDSYNPAPRPSDQPEATRERKRASRARARDTGVTTGSGHADVTRDPSRDRADAPFAEVGSKKKEEQHSTERADGRPDNLLEQIAAIQAVFAEFAPEPCAIDEVSVANALARFPNADHIQVAHGCAEYLRANSERDAGLTFHRFLEEDTRRNSVQALPGRRLRAVPDRPKRFESERTDFSNYDDLVNR